MPIISVRIPQLGEGLQEALLVEFLKKPGDDVRRDEPLYVMETDKATTDVESPYEGKLVEWTVETGTVLEIGAEIGRMEVAEGVKEMPAGHGPETGHAASDSGRAAAGTRLVETAAKSTGNGADASSSELVIPPKTRKYLKEKGLLDVASQIPRRGKKLMPEDVDAYLATGGVATMEKPAGAAAPPVATNEFAVTALPQSQIVLNYRLVRGAQLCVPVTVANEVDWEALEAAREATRDRGGPTAFAMACWGVVQALKRHERFRSVLASDNKHLKVFHRVNLGVAVALPGDLMVTAVIRDADQMSQQDFFATMQQQIELARNGKDQADESTTLTVSNIGKAGMRIGIPAIVAPAVATLAIGEVYLSPVPDGSNVRFAKRVIATLSFDHRVANGVGAANFLNDVKSEIEAFKLMA